MRVPDRPLRRVVKGPDHGSTPPMSRILRSCRPGPRDDDGGGPGKAVRRRIRDQPGSEFRYGAIELANWYPVVASQLIDQVITPRISGYVRFGWKSPQLVP